jgi:hypothetical protein
MLNGGAAPHDGTAIQQLYGAPELRLVAVAAGNILRHRLRPDIHYVPVVHVKTPKYNSPVFMLFQKPTCYASILPVPARKIICGN